MIIKTYDTNEVLPYGTYWYDDDGIKYVTSSADDTKYVKNYTGKILFRMPNLIKYDGTTATALDHTLPNDSYSNYSNYYSSIKSETTYSCTLNYSADDSSGEYGGVFYKSGGSTSLVFDKEKRIRVFQKIDVVDNPSENNLLSYYTYSNKTYTLVGSGTTAVSDTTYYQTSDVYAIVAFDTNENIPKALTGNPYNKNSDDGTKGGWMLLSDTYSTSSSTTEILKIN